MAGFSREGVTGASAGFTGAGLLFESGGAAGSLLLVAAGGGDGLKRLHQVVELRIGADRSYAESNRQHYRFHFVAPFWKYCFFLGSLIKFAKLRVKYSIIRLTPPLKPLTELVTSPIGDVQLYFYGGR